MEKRCFYSSERNICYGQRIIQTQNKMTILLWVFFILRIPPRKTPASSTLPPPLHPPLIEKSRLKGEGREAKIEKSENTPRSSAVPPRLFLLGRRPTFLDEDFFRSDHGSTTLWSPPPMNILLTGSKIPRPICTKPNLFIAFLKMTSLRFSDWPCLPYRP